VGWGPDRWRLYRLALREAARSVRGLSAPLVRFPRLRAPTPGRLLFAPHDLRTADPTVANDIYGGYFVFADRVLSTGGRSPFDFPPPSPAWGEAFYGFGWLRHLRAADTAIARANARSLVADFLKRGRREPPIARETHVLARRLVAFLSQSPLLLEGAEHDFYHRFQRAIGRAVRDLERDIPRPLRPERRLSAAVALCYAGLCCDGFDAVLRRGTRLLARELDRQILPDGGHISRNPRLLVELLLDLLPLRQTFASRGLEAPRALMQAIDRMLPMLRLLRHGDGTLSHFNGMGRTAADHLATLLMYDEARAQPLMHAPHSGYERLAAGTTLLVADVGPAPATRFSADAHAGCLSFELSSGGSRIVINCGAGSRVQDGFGPLGRATAAHSTVTAADASSCRFVDVQGWWGERALGAWLVRRLGPAILTGPANVPAERSERDGVESLTASHDGYRDRFGLVHERRWRLTPDGDRLDGEDRFQREADGPDDAVVRFHLHPGVVADMAESDAVRLRLPSGEIWHFAASCDGTSLAESVFFAATDGMRRAEQIVIPLRMSETPLVRWRFERMPA
jgi:uncharacterized heparinase superfamily protein